MKFQLFSFLLAFLFSANFASAQKLKSEVIPVSGNCGMCEALIEKTAKKAGVADADWDKGTKMLTIKYNPKATDALKIQKAIAGVGYDTRDVRGDDSAYANLHSCCKYERTKKYSGVSTKNKGGDDSMACCENSDKQCCKDKMEAKKAGKNAECKKDAVKDCCKKA